MALTKNRPIRRMNYEGCFLIRTKYKGLVKKYRGVGGGPEQRWGGSSVFEPLVSGGSCNFQLPVGGGSSCFYYGN